MPRQYISRSSFKTKKLGENLAKKILNSSPQKGAWLVGLEGDLGSGKTTFLQGFAKGLGIKEKILSPTFILMRKFKIPKTCNLKPNNLKPKTFYHIDCYRIQKPKEILALGFKKIISNPENIVAIEWADRIRRGILLNAVWIIFEFGNKNIRKIKVV